MRALKLLLSVALALGASGCLDERRYITPEGGGPWAFALDADTPPFFTSDDGDVFLVEQRVEIPFREPTDEERAALGDVGELQIPFPQLPYLRRGDFEIQLDYTISNLSPDQTVTVAVTINGFNEFHEYNPGFQIVENMIVADYSGWERTLRLEPGARQSGTVREEHFDEVAVDLATVVNGVPNANQIVHPQSHSAVDARSQLFIPEVIPALTGARVGMRVLTGPGASPPPLVMELAVRVRDVRRVLVQGEDEPWVAPTPVLFGPMDIAASMTP